jgi:hypothetical protein
MNVLDHALRTCTVYGILRITLNVLRCTDAPQALHICSRHANCAVYLLNIPQ